MDVVEYRREIFMAQQLLQAEWVVALDEVVHGKRVSKDMWTDALPGDPRAFFEPLEEHFHAILRQGLARLGEKDVIFSCTAPLGQFFLVWAMLI